MNCRTGPTEKGTCKTADVASGTNGYGFTLSANKMDCFSAEKFCKALKKTMVSLDDFHITSSGYCTDIYEGCWANMGAQNLSGRAWWTKDLYPSDSGYAFQFITDYTGRDSMYSLNRSYRDANEFINFNRALCR